MLLKALEEPVHFARFHGFAENKAFSLGEEGGGIRIHTIGEENKGGHLIANTIEELDPVATRETDSAKDDVDLEAAEEFDCLRFGTYRNGTVASAGPKRNKAPLGRGVRLKDDGGKSSGVVSGFCLNSGFRGVDMEGGGQIDFHATGVLASLKDAHIAS